MMAPIPKKERQSEVKIIVQIDGGGCKGVIPATVLSALSNKVGMEVGVFARREPISSPLRISGMRGYV